MRGFEYPSGMPAILDQNQQDYSTQVSKALGLQARTPGNLDQRIQLGINIDDLTAPEFWYLRKGELGSLTVPASAVAGQVCYAQLQPAPGKVVVVTAFTVVNYGALFTVCSYGFALAEGGGSVGSGLPRDDRNLPGQLGSTVRYGASAVPIVPINGQVLVGVNQSIRTECEFVMTSPTKLASPFNVFKIVGSQLNQRLDISIEWRERAILPTEVS